MTIMINASTLQIIVCLSGCRGIRVSCELYQDERDLSRGVKLPQIPAQAVKDLGFLGLRVYTDFSHPFRMRLRGKGQVVQRREFRIH